MTATVSYKGCFWLSTLYLPGVSNPQLRQSHQRPLLPSISFTQVIRTGRTVADIAKLCGFLDPIVRGVSCAAILCFAIRDEKIACLSGSVWQAQKTAISDAEHPMTIILLYKTGFIPRGMNSD